MVSAWELGDYLQRGVGSVLEICGALWSTYCGEFDVVRVAGASVLEVSGM